MFEQQVEQIRDDYRNTGLALVVVRDNKVVYSRAFGFRTLASDSLSDGQPLCTSHLFRIASISKSFTTVALLQQIEQGKTSLHADVSELLGFPVRNPAFPDSVITLEMLLSHTSSLNDSFCCVSDLDPAVNPDCSAAYNAYAPACGYCYADFNITLAGAILERLALCRFDDCIRTHVLSPLGINGGFNVDSLPADSLVTLYAVEIDKPAVSYTNCYRSVDLQDYRLGYDTHRFAPASGLKISADGLTRYMLFLMNYGITPDGSRLISSADAHDMYRQRFESYHHCGLTLLRTDDYSPGVSLYGHKGGAYGLRSAYYFNPEQKYGFIVISSGSLPEPLSSTSAVIDTSSLYVADGEGDISIRVPLLRLMYQTFIDRQDTKQQKGGHMQPM